MGTAEQAPERLCVVVPSLNTVHHLRTMLDSLGRQRNVACRTVVVDMSSTDGTLEMLATEFSHVTVCSETPNHGYGSAVNVGASIADTEWVLVCNSDVRFTDPDTLSKLIAVGNSSPSTGIVGPRLVGAGGQQQHAAFKLPSRLALAAAFCAPLRYFRRMNARALGYLDEDSYESPTDVGWMSGAVFLARVEAFRAVGAFDPYFFMNCEEVDLCARMHASGWSVVLAPQETVVHDGGGSTPAGARGLIWLVEGQARYTKKHFGKGALAGALALSGVAYASSLPVWLLRSVVGRQTWSAGLAEAAAYGKALGAAHRV